MLDKIFTENWADMGRFSIPGLIVMALGVALCALAGKLAKGDEKRYYVFKFGGLIATMVGTIIAIRMFG